MTRVGRVISIGLVFAAASCQFPESCDPYPPGAGDESATPSRAETDDCRLTLEYEGRTYVSRSGVLVTRVGEELGQVEVKRCRREDEATGGRSGPTVTTFRFADYCTNDVLAVEVEPGQQLQVWEARNDSGLLPSDPP